MPRVAGTAFDKNTVRNAQPTEKRYEITDARCRGLTLVVLPSGSKIWYARLDSHTRRRIGNAELMTLSVARQRVEDLRVQNRHDPLTTSNSTTKLRDFIEGEYADYCEANHKASTATVERILSVGSTPPNPNSKRELLDYRMDELNEALIERWKARRLTKNQATTVKRELGALKAALARATAWGLLRSNPATNIQVKAPRHRRVRYLESDERARLLDALFNRDKKRRKDGKEFYDYLTPLVLLVMNTGLRRNEALTLTWDRVWLDASPPQIMVYASHAKTGKTRYVALNQNAVEALRRWRKQSEGNGLVFPNPHTGEKIEKLRTSWPGLLKAAEIEDFRFHDLRHDFASQLVMAGVSLYQVKELLGHDSIEMTERYAHLSPHSLAQGVETLPKVHYLQQNNMEETASNGEKRKPEGVESQ